MKNIFLFLLFAISAISHQCVAQSATQIMDARIKFTNISGVHHGTLKVNLTDTQNLNTIIIKIGSVRDSSDVFSQTYNLNALPSGSSVSNGIITINMGTLPVLTEYYTAVKITLANNDERVIKFYTAE